MKKILKKIVLFSLVFLIICPLVACGEHVHTFNSDWSYDSTYHWHESTCEHDEIKDKELHQSTFKEEIEGSIIYDVTYCSECGYVLRREVHDHTFGESWETDATHHWHGATCRHTELVSDYSEHNLAVRTTADGIYDETYCTVCGYIVPSSRVLHIHTFDSKWEYDGTYHWHDATCVHTDLIQGIEEHHWVHQEVEQEGVLYDVYTCEVCDIYIISPHVHTFSDSEMEYDEEYHWYKSTCGHDNVAEKIPHAFLQTIEIDDNNNSYLIEFCDCGYVKSRTLLSGQE